MSISPAAYALLGFLSSGPASGYDLKVIARATVSYFWAVGDNQVYPLLDRLEESGLVSSERVAAAGRREKTVFHITAEGEAALGVWLRQTPKAASFRHPGLIRMFFAAELPDADLAALIDHEERALTAKLDELHQLRVSGTPPDQPARNRHDRLMQLTFAFGSELTETELRWWQSARRELLPRDDGDGIGNDASTS
ncbi:PadR family transcriptional regulator [Tsukamurella sp. 8F]|uniref:PadR family transcriptional regulator n=1 Tax=unclassified Tsukamurella TaxID=2633480 RepID=UPI0023B8F781|nr:MULTISPECIES: PadR family transcriptional regulator [unclassified Tsukamurella]MDF0531822.1 PadR family transcriptional regulator [Tsukamurella sp. 8J]MDF0589064.1 PadR family transcriptional regulator [Tsukamurella sp. 8F]